MPWIFKHFAIFIEKGRNTQHVSDAGTHRNYLFTEKFTRILAKGKKYMIKTASNNEVCTYLQVFRNRTAGKTIFSVDCQKL